MAPQRSVPDDRRQEALAVAGGRPGWGRARRFGPEPAGQTGRQLAITHIFPCSINGLLASLKGVSFCAEPFEGAPFRVILSGSNIDRGRNYNCPCGWSKMWVIASFIGGDQVRVTC